MSKNLTVDEIIDTPEFVGLEIVTEEVKKGGYSYPVSFFKVVDLDLFTQNFGKQIVLDEMDGVSFRVTFQRIVRDYVSENRDNVKNTREQLSRCAKYLLGERNRGEILRYIALDGTKHATMEEARVASMEYVKNNS